MAIAVGNYHRVVHGTNAGRSVHQCGDQHGQLAQTQSQMTQMTKLVNDVELVVDAHRRVAFTIGQI